MEGIFFLPIVLVVTELIYSFCTFILSCQVMIMSSCTGKFFHYMILRLHGNIYKVVNSQNISVVPSGKKIIYRGGRK